MTFAVNQQRVVEEEENYNKFEDLRIKSSIQSQKLRKNLWFSLSFSISLHQKFKALNK